MEEKIYERQVTKETLSQRVIDEHQLDRHFTASDLQELYVFKPDRLDDPNTPERPTPKVPKVRNLISPQSQYHTFPYISHTFSPLKQVSEGQFWLKAVGKQQPRYNNGGDGNTFITMVVLKRHLTEIGFNMFYRITVGVLCCDWRLKHFFYYASKNCLRLLHSRGLYMEAYFIHLPQFVYPSFHGLLYPKHASTNWCVWYYTPWSGYEDYLHHINFRYDPVWPSGSHIGFYHTWRHSSEKTVLCSFRLFSAAHCL